MDTVNNSDVAAASDPWPEPTGSGERFSERTLRSVAAFVRGVVFSREFTMRIGLMQGLDARVKVVTVLGVVVAISLCRYPHHLAALCIVAFAIAAASRIPAAVYLRRVWSIVPLFSAMIALPALVLVPGDPVTASVRIFAWKLAVTRQGAESALMFFLRVGASVSFIELLALTTGWGALMGALRSLRVPPLFVLLIGITYRYIFYFLTFIEEQYYGRKSRAFGRAGGGLGEGRRWVAGRMGFTLSRAMRMGDDVYEAMASRGFSGEARFIDTSRPGVADALWFAGVVCGVFAMYVTGGFG